MCGLRNNVILSCTAPPSSLYIWHVWADTLLRPYLYPLAESSNTIHLLYTINGPSG